MGFWMSFLISIKVNVSFAFEFNENAQLWQLLSISPTVIVMSKATVRAQSWRPKIERENTLKMSYAPISQMEEKSKRDL